MMFLALGVLLAMGDVERDVTAPLAGVLGGRLDVLVSEHWTPAHHAVEAG
jgi:hypothetical protein